MARKRTHKDTPPLPLNPLPSGPGSWNFDSLEEKIRGEEVLLKAEHKLAKRESEIKKELDTAEIDRRLKALRDKIKPTKK